MFFGKFWKAQIALLFATCCLVWTVCAAKAQCGTVDCEIDIFRKTIDKFPNFREGSPAFECEIRRQVRHREQLLQCPADSEVLLYARSHPTHLGGGLFDDEFLFVRW